MEMLIDAVLRARLYDPMTAVVTLALDPHNGFVFVNPTPGPGPGNWDPKKVTFTFPGSQAGPQSFPLPFIIRNNGSGANPTVTITICNQQNQNERDSTDAPLYTA
jgi:hypothetical protein